MKKTLPILIVLGLALAACGNSATDVPPTADAQIATIVASTMQAMTAQAAPTNFPLLSGGRFEFNNIKMIIPQGMASGATGETVTRVETADGGPTWGVAPDYTRVTLQDYAIGKRFHEPQIFIYPADEFAQMNEGAATIMGELRTILSATSPLPAQLPHLPIFNAQQMLTSHAKLVDFGSGRGVRYITQYSQAFIPINNNELFYTFQGITSDGKYYVAVQLPISAAIIDTIVMPDVSSPNFTPEQWTQYLQDMTKTLNSLGEVFFSPSFDMLDSFVHSIQVTP